MFPKSHEVFANNISVYLKILGHSTEKFKLIRGLSYIVTHGGKIDFLLASEKQLENINALGREEKFHYSISTWKTMKLDPYFIPYTKNRSEFKLKC